MSTFIEEHMKKLESQQSATEQELASLKADGGKMAAFLSGLENPEGNPFPNVNVIQTSRILTAWEAFKKNGHVPWKPKAKTGATQDEGKKPKS